MDLEHSAFGLTLRPSFPLPGLVAGTAGSLPVLELELESPQGLHDAWSGPGGIGVWRGSLGDGSELTIEWGAAGDLLFGYADRARFLLEPDRGRLLCAPSDRSSVAWQRVLLSRVLPVVALARGYEALHAGAVQTGRGVVAVAGLSGAGKSTLVAELWRRGHRLFADDVLVVGTAAHGEVLAYPSGPHLSLDAATTANPPGETLGSLGGKHWLAVEGAAREPAPLAAVILLERGEGKEMGSVPIPLSPLVLAPFMLGLPDEEGRDRERFAIYSDLVERTRLIRLTGSPADPPASLADELESALALAAAPIAGGRS